VSGVCSAVFSTTVLPIANAGPHFHACISSGKFHYTHTHIILVIIIIIIGNRKSVKKLGQDRRQQAAEEKH